MTHYEIVACVVFGLCLWKTGTNNFMGSVGVSLAWPIIIPVLIYSIVKKLVTTRRKRPFDISEIEVSLCVIAAVPLFFWVLYLIHNPFAVELVASYRK